jgi:hypothetical protein
MTVWAGAASLGAVGMTNSYLLFHHERPIVASFAGCHETGRLARPSREGGHVARAGGGRSSAAQHVCRPHLTACLAPRI